MTNPSDIELLTRYADGEVTDEERRAVEELLADDVTAQRHLAQLKAIGDALRRSVQAKVDNTDLSDLWPSIEIRIGKSKPHSLIGRLQRYWTFPRLRVALPVALVLTVVGTYTLRDTQSNDSHVSDKLSDENAVTITEEITREDILAEDNTLIVESYEVSSGAGIIDQNADDALAPTVIWHFESPETNEG